MGGVIELRSSETNANTFIDHLCMYHNICYMFNYVHMLYNYYTYTVITWRQILQDACTRKNLAAGYSAIDSEFTEDRIAP